MTLIKGSKILIGYSIWYIKVGAKIFKKTKVILVGKNHMMNLVIFGLVE